jgi:hypothetical protein
MTSPAAHNGAAHNPAAHNGAAHNWAARYRTASVSESVVRGCNHG